MFKRGYKARYVRIVFRARAWRAPFKFFKWRRMSSKKEYDLVSNDDYDTRIPLHPDEAFQYGITFRAKYIGTMEVPRPSSRVEIVAAMRRVRYEFKSKGVKKRKVTVDVSTNGVRVTLRTKKKPKTGKRKFFSRRRKSDSSCETLELMNHPIYRIFYVSHDSSDLKIFSYIARDGATNEFKCNVFKSSKKTPEINERPRKKLSFREPEIVSGGSGTLGRSNKLMGVNSLTRRPNRISLRSDLHSSLDGLDSDLESQAMRIVRTVGQAFEVCHKMQANTQDNPVPSTSSAIDEPVASSSSYKGTPPKEPASECGGSESGGASTSKVVVEEPPHEKKAVRPKHLDLLPPPPRKEGKRTTQQAASVPSINLPDLPECVTKVEITAGPDADATTPLSAQHQLKLLRERLEQQAQQTQAAVAQLMLLKDQLAAEQAARCEIQARTHQLLVHNKELLEHIATLVALLQDREKGNARPINAQQLTLLPQKPEVMNGVQKTEPNGNQIKDDDLINFIVQNSKSEQAQNAENNNIRPSFSPTPSTSGVNTTQNGPNTHSGPDFDNMTNDQIQDYLIAKFQSMPFLNSEGGDDNRQFYQNSNAFPHIPPISSHVSNSDLASLLNNQMKGASGSSDDFGLAQAMSIGQSQNSLYSNSQDSSSKDSSPDSSSDDGLPYIMPLSHNAILKATGDDGRVRLIVPVSPSESAADVVETQRGPSTSGAGNSLQVPSNGQAPITRTTSEKVPNRSELMAALRAQWTRHTTK